MENSDTTISANFLENLWSLILENNECEIKNANTREYFMPEKNFDHIWAHELLAKKGHDDYKPASELKCPTLEQPPTELKAETEVEQLPYRGPQVDILPIDQQLALFQQDVDIRKKLAYDFANRQFPWYIQRSLQHKQFMITPGMEKLFKNKFEFEILRNIQRFQCHLMIIDVAPAVPLIYMERWLKFSPYASIITVIHDGKLFKKIENFNNVFQPVVIEEHLGCTWQEQLEHSLDMGVKKAKELFLLDDMNKPMIFVFSQNRGICACDSFKILKKS